MTVPLRQTGSSGTASVLSNQYVVVQAVDLDKRIAHVVNQVKASMTVSMVHMIGKGVGYPAVGETWLISSQFGSWMFVAQVNPTFPDLSVFVQSTDSRLIDARRPTGAAGGALGGTYPNPTIPTPFVNYMSSLLNGWVNYGAPFENANYYKGVDGVVHLGGMVKAGTISTTSTGTISVLPVGYRPTAKRAWNIICGNNTGGRCDVDTAGNILAVATGSGSNAFWSLDGITFLAGN